MEVRKFHRKNRVYASIFKKDSVNLPRLIKRSELMIHATTWMDLKGLMLSEKKAVSKGYILHDSMCITFLKWQNYKDGKSLVAGKYGYRMWL